MVIRV